MQLYKYLIPLSFFSLPAILHAQRVADEPMTLEKIWLITDTANRQLKLADLEKAESAMDVRISRDKLLPQLAVAGDLAIRTNMPIYTKGLLSKPDIIPISRLGYRFGYNLDFNLYNGGKDRRYIEIKKKEALRQENENALRRNNLRYTVATAYYNLYKFLQFRSFLSNEIATEKKQLATIESFYRNGIVLKSDVLRSEVKISQLELTLSDVEKSIMVARQRLNMLMGRGDEELLTITPPEILESAAPLLYADYGDYVVIALNRSPDYKLSMDNLKISELNIQQIKAELLPRVSFFSNYLLTYPQTSFYPYSNDPWGFTQAGIKVALSLDSFYKNRHLSAKAMLINRQEAEKVRIKRDEITMDIREAYLRYEQALESVKTATAQIKQHTESVRVIRSSYLNQESLLTDLLDAESALLEANFNLVAAEVDVRLDYIGLLVKTGIL
ncbi:TolC family protein [Chitinophaga sp. MD30]|uniref:TolC family protein n=1 Tax=Chitinophaga sp. MD30 TaxID=2033437 RepID=UPI000BAEE515|nr:TolC family protein [Chitinophaga sp. MD30]ASZ12122.1 transporter [Chitinophaga sp. MD30]